MSVALRKKKVNWVKRDRQTEVGLPKDDTLSGLPSVARETPVLVVADPVVLLAALVLVLVLVLC